MCNETIRTRRWRHFIDERQESDSKTPTESFMNTTVVRFTLALAVPFSASLCGPSWPFMPRKVFATLHQGARGHTTGRVKSSVLGIEITPPSTWVRWHAEDLPMALAFSGPPHGLLQMSIGAIGLTRAHPSLPLIQAWACGAQRADEEGGTSSTSLSERPARYGGVAAIDVFVKPSEHQIVLIHGGVVYQITTFQTSQSGDISQDQHAALASFRFVGRPGHLSPDGVVTPCTK